MSTAASFVMKVEQNILLEGLPHLNSWKKEYVNKTIDVVKHNLIIHLSSLTLLILSQVNVTEIH